MNKYSVPATLLLKIRNEDVAASVLSSTKSIPGAKGVKLVDSPAGNLSFTPESYKFWINKIVLQNHSGLSNQFYQGENSEADFCRYTFRYTFRSEVKCSGSLPRYLHQSLVILLTLIGRVHQVQG
ncbi:MAG: hypothetical protein EOP10_16545 [Proteobacteria bacterium]|nr:MAG: hypothetical protein EOP10_16545 [Pseudomonadota bacterium]